MVEELMAPGEFGQPVAITPFLMAGASAPVTLAGGLSLLVAETLVRRCYGAAGSARGRRASWAPSSTVWTCGPAARHWACRSRCSRRLQVASSPDDTAYRCVVVVVCVQVSTWTCRQRRRARCRCGPPTSPKCDLVVHAAGWIEGGLVADYEKLAFRRRRTEDVRADPSRDRRRRRAARLRRDRTAGSWWALPGR